jgi:hypothetical protein
VAVHKLGRHRLELADRRKSDFPCIGLRNKHRATSPREASPQIFFLRNASSVPNIFFGYLIYYINRTETQSSASRTRRSEDCQRLHTSPLASASCRDVIDTCRKLRRRRSFRKGFHFDFTPDLAACIDWSDATHGRPSGMGLSGVYWRPDNQKQSQRATNRPAISSMRSRGSGGYWTKVQYRNTQQSSMLPLG